MNDLTTWLRATVEGDTIARCEAELAILDEHAIIERKVGWLETDEDQQIDISDHLPVCRVCVPKNTHFETRADVPTGSCRTVRLLAYGYRHRPGWREEWTP